MVWVDLVIWFRSLRKKYDDDNNGHRRTLRQNCQKLPFDFEICEGKNWWQSIRKSSEVCFYWILDWKIYRWHPSYNGEMCHNENQSGLDAIFSFGTIRNQFNWIWEPVIIHLATNSLISMNICTQSGELTYLHIMRFRVNRNVEILADICHIQTHGIQLNTQFIPKGWCSLWF